MRMKLSLQYYYFLLLLLLASQIFVHARASIEDYPTANLSTQWTNNVSSKNSVFQDGTVVRPVLLRGQSGASFACGFFCNGACHTYLFAIYIVYTDSGSAITGYMRDAAQVVWSANRNNPVKENATLRFSSDGNLILQDEDGTTVWSTNTAGRSVAGMSLTEKGNLVLFDESNATVWDSFDYPTDSLILGQTLREGQRLTTNVSAANWTAGQLYLTVVPGGLAAYADADPPQVYYLNADIALNKSSLNKSSTHVTFSNSSLNIFTSLAARSPQNFSISLPQASSMQYMRLESDGHLRLYDWAFTDTREGWLQVADIFQLDELFRMDDNCDYPTVCGEYGFCSSGQCSCLSPTYFSQVNERQVNLGCSLVTPLSCQSAENHRLLSLDAVSYFSYHFDVPSMSADEEICKQACLKNCSCKAVFFKYYSNISEGNCYLPTKVFSMMSYDQNSSGYNSTAYIKVQDPARVPNPPPPPPPNRSKAPRKKTVGVGVIVGVTMGALLVASLAIGFVIMLVVRRRDVAELDEEDQFDKLAGLPRRFSFEELEVATKGFCYKLGEGGFGSVFEGTLSDGVKIAVKRLDRIGQGKKEFLAEVKTIGNIHHIDLVKLIGFCSEKSSRLLVYELMSNGSLDKWIFGRSQDTSLDWQTRVQIITDIAKGLSYLHEECQQQIAHLDIKPQNILLDEGLRAKIADFGLSKLIDRDQSHVSTAMRGTRGYLAPEWLTSKITEKADVFSFGVVIMEIMCGRKNLDYSQPEERVHLVTMLQNKVRENQLLDIADRSSDMQLHESEVVEMMGLAMWCLQTDFTKRPKMSTVVKVLEGSANVETDIEYNFTVLTPRGRGNAENLDASALRSAWPLSGPR